MGTARDIITRSLKRLGVVGAGEAVQAADFEDCADGLNTLIDSLVIEGAGLPRLSVVNQAVTWSAGTPSYVSAPTNFLNSLLLYRTDNGSPVPLKPYTVQMWSDLQQKTATGVPDKFFEGTDGRWYLHPVPTSDPGITATFIERPTEVADAATGDVDFPAEWMLPLEYGLVYHMADHFKQDAMRWLKEWERLRIRALASSVHGAPITFSVDD